jgi:hypothetical protein
VSYHALALLGSRDSLALGEERSGEMEKRARLREDICRSFNELRWHDSKLRGIEISNNTIVLEVLFRGDNPTETLESRMTMNECTIVKMHIDLEWKRLVSHDISSAICKKDSEIKSEIENALQREQNPLRDYLHFSLSLIPPAGSIDIFAKSFEVVKRSS